MGSSICPVSVLDSTQQSRYSRGRTSVLGGTWQYILCQPWTSHSHVPASTWQHVAAYRDQNSVLNITSQHALHQYRASVFSMAAAYPMSVLNLCFAACATAVLHIVQWPIMMSVPYAAYRDVPK
eukprot:3941935-Rhodomonas_salina.3